MPLGRYTARASQSDGAGNTGTATSTFTIGAPPVCQAVVVHAVSGHPAAIRLHCSTVAGLPDTFSVLSGPRHGRLTNLNSGAGTASYTPSPDYSGRDGLTYRATNGAGASNTAAVSIAIVFPPPVLTDLRQSHQSWREGTRPPRLTAGDRSRSSPPTGTTFTFTLNEPARVTLTFVRTSPSRVRQQLTVTAHRGQNQLSFQGHLSSTKRLPAGRYTVTFSAVNAQGKSTRPQSLTFTILA